jgi:hypothetical protein
MGTGSKEKSLSDKVRGWLVEQGYPLEMQVARVFRNAGFYVQQSTYYEDSESGKLREIDVTAQLHSPSSTNVLLQVAFFVECKWTGDKPWLLFTSEHEQGRSSLSQRAIFSKSLQPFIAQEQWVTRTLPEEIQRLSIFNPPNLGYGITQTLTSSSTKDVPFQAITGAVKAALGRAKHLESFTSQVPTMRMAGIAFPVVVIQGKLFICKLDDKSADGVMVEEVDRGAVVVKHINEQGVGHLPVHIVTRAALDQFTQQAHADSSTLIEYTASNEEKVVHAFDHFRTSTEAL